MEAVRSDELAHVERENSEFKMSLERLTPRPMGCRKASKEGKRWIDS